MTLEQNQHGTFHVTNVPRTLAKTAGGKFGFKLWTEEDYEARQKAKQVAKKK